MLKIFAAARKAGEGQRRTKVAPPLTSDQEGLLSGWTITATVDASDDYLVDYQWFKGALGTTSSPIGGVTTSTSIFVQPTSLPTTYWVRVRYLDNGCYRDKAITIQ
jgi:hypothetical protein